MNGEHGWLAVFLSVVFGLNSLAIVGFWLESDKAEQLIEHTHLVTQNLKSLGSTVQSVESSVRGYINTGQELFLRNSYQSEAKAQGLLDSLGILVADNGEQRFRLVHVKELVGQKFEWESALISAYQQHGTQSSAALCRTLQGMNLMERFRAPLREMLETETILLKMRSNKYHVYRALLLAAAGFLSIFGAVGLWQAIKLGKLAVRLQAQQVLAYERLDLVNQGLNRQMHDLLTAQEDTSRALRIRSEFLAKVSHELRTPLAGVIGATELVLAMPLREEQREWLVTAKQCGESLLDLVNELLDFEKMEFKEFRLRPASFDLRLLIESALQPLTIRAKEKGLALDLKVSDGVPFLAYGDRLRIQQILVNLVDNAIKFTDEGSVSVRVSLDASEANQAMVRFTVEDTGMGIDAENLPVIFDPFGQVDSSSTRRHNGTGLGLAISKKLVDLMNGKLEVSSNVGQGSKLSFVIPIQLTEPASLSSDTANAASFSKADSILVVEDSDTIRKVTEFQLRRLGYKAKLVSSGKEAIEATLNQRFLLILMDVQMPGIDGLEATKIIRTMPDNPCCDLPIVALTAHAMEDDRQKCLTAGMNDYIAKPVTLESLQSILSAWVTTDGGQIK